MVGRAEKACGNIRSLVFLQQNRMKQLLGGGNSNIFAIFTPIPGEMIQFDEHIFQRG